MSNITGILRIVSGTTYFGNRTAISNGDRITLAYSAGRVGDDTNTYSIPSVVWLKDGVPTRNRSTIMVVGSNGQLNSTLTFNFQESDAGVYQCIFICSSSEIYDTTEIYGTTPLRLDTGILVLCCIALLVSCCRGKERGNIIVVNFLVHVVGKFNPCKLSKKLQTWHAQFIRMDY